MEFSSITTGIAYFIIVIGFVVISLLAYDNQQTSKKILGYSSGVAILVAILFMGGGIKELSTPLIKIGAQNDAKEISSLLEQSKEAAGKIKTLEVDTEKTKNELSEQLGETKKLKHHLEEQSKALDCALGDMPTVSKIIGINLTIDSIKRRLVEPSENVRKILNQRLEENYWERKKLERQLICIDPAKLEGELPAR